LTVYSTVSAHHTRFARCGIFRSPSAFLVPGRPFARPLAEQKCQGFSPLQPRHRLFVRHAVAVRRRGGRELPAPIGWGSERRGNAAGACCHPTVRPGSLLCCRTLPQSLGLAFQGAGLALTGIETPRAFHGLNQRLGTNRRGSIEGQRLAGAAIEGSHRPFDLCAPSHPCAKRMTTGPVRALRLPVAGQFAPRGMPAAAPQPDSSVHLARRAFARFAWLSWPRAALSRRETPYWPCGLPWGASPRCFESASTTDVSRHEHPQLNHLLWRLPAERRGKPAGVRLRDPPRTWALPLRSGKTPDHLAVIQPPAALCLTARCRLRTDRLSRCAFALRDASAAAFSAAFAPCRSSPLTPLA
jgi:hypothetical protein